MPPSDISSAKAALRSQLRAQRQALPPEERARQSTLLARKLSRQLQRRRVTSLGAYEAVGSELDLSPLRAQLPTRCVWHLPLIRGQILLFAPADGPLRPGRHGIPEPQGGPLRQPWALPLLLLPLLACDEHGMRLGQGGGWYDRTLSACGQRLPLTIGVGFDLQWLPEVPAEAHDRPLDIFLSAGQARAFSPRGEQWLTGY